MIDATGNACTRIFLGKDHLLGKAGIAAAPLLWPTDAAPLVRGELLLPLLAALGLGGQRGDALDVGKFAGHLALEPRGAFGAEIFFGA